MRASTKHELFVDAYFRLHFNATDAYCEVYGTNRVTGAVNGSKLLRNSKIADEIKRRIAEQTMTADEVILKLGEQARSDIRVFFKIVEEWTFYPLPTYEVIDAKEVIDDSDPDNPRTRVSYWCRHICIDLDKVIDPQYSHLLSEFTDSPKNGLGIKVYNKLDAIKTMAKIRGLMVDRTENLNIDLSTLTDEQLDMLSAGESIANVLKRTSTKSRG
jgi:hypothetical protein